MTLEQFKESIEENSSEQNLALKEYLKGEVKILNQKIESIRAIEFRRDKENTKKKERQLLQQLQNNEQKKEGEE
jgi:uncharacterized membrane protein